jgi:hypothetical protein
MKDLTTRKVEDLNSSFDEVLAAQMSKNSKPVANGVKARLLAARKEILETKVKKEGKNSFSKYEYYTPSQITALVTKACINNGLITTFSIKEKKGTYTGYLNVMSLDSDDEIIFHVPTAMPDIKATNITQKLGGMMTYTLRYLEMIAFSITDNNLDLNSQDNRGEKVKKTISDTDFKRGLDKMGSVKFKTFLNDYEMTKEQVLMLNAKQF